MSCETCGCEWDGNCPAPEATKPTPAPLHPKAAQEGGERWYPFALKIVRQAYVNNGRPVIGNADELEAIDLANLIAEEAAALTSTQAEEQWKYDDSGFKRDPNQAIGKEVPPDTPDRLPMRHVPLTSAPVTEGSGRTSSEPQVQEDWQKTAERWRQSYLREFNRRIAAEHGEPEPEPSAGQEATSSSTAVLPTIEVPCASLLERHLREELRIANTNLAGAHEIIRQLKASHPPAEGELGRRMYEMSVKSPTWEEAGCLCQAAWKLDAKRALAALAALSAQGTGEKL